MSSDEANLPEVVANQDKLISKIVSNIIKDKGDGFASVLGDNSLRPYVKDWLSTGSLALDKSICPWGSGFPVGRLIEIYGDEASSKTTLLWHVLASTQKKNGVAALIEPESAAFDVERAKRIGIVPEDLIYTAPDTIEDVFDVMENIITTAVEEDPDRLITIGWDSVAATSTRKEVEGEFGDSVMGEHARLISQGLRKIMSTLKTSSGITLVFINQQRDKIGGYGGQTTFGGKAIKFYASLRLKLKPEGVIQGVEGKPLGMNFESYVVKNKIAPPFGKATYKIMFDSGGGVIDYLDSVFVAALEKKVLIQAGPRYKYGDDSFYRKDWKEFLEQHPDLIGKI